MAQLPRRSLCASRWLTCPVSPLCFQMAHLPSVAFELPDGLPPSGTSYTQMAQLPRGATVRPEGSIDRWYHLSGDQTSNQNTPQCVSTVNLPETPQCVRMAKLAQSVQISQFLTPSHCTSNNLLTLFYRNYIYIHAHTIHMYIVWMIFRCIYVGCVRV